MSKANIHKMRKIGTYDHRSVKTGHPVRSAILSGNPYYCVFFCLFAESSSERENSRCTPQNSSIFHTDIMRRGHRDETVASEIQCSIGNKHTARLTRNSTC
jgi:hypothetical protein